MATEEERKNNKIQGKPSVHCGSGIVGVGRPIFLLFFSALPADIRGGNSGARRGPAATASPAVRVVQLGARKKRRELPLFFCSDLLVGLERLRPLSKRPRLCFSTARIDAWNGRELPTFGRAMLSMFIYHVRLALEAFISIGTTSETGFYRLLFLDGPCLI